MATPKLNPKIIEYLAKKTGLAESTIRSNISRVRTDYPSCTINAGAQLYARKHGLSVMQKLSSEDKATLPHNEITAPKIKIEKAKKKTLKKIDVLIEYESNDYFIKGHIKEVNKAYTYGCYTAAIALTRKILENLIREILSNKYPASSKQNKELYFDINKNRVHDFSVVLNNLQKNKADFGMEKAKIIDRLHQRVKSFKDDSNDKVHSWYHLVESRKEVDDLNIQSIFELIKKLE